MAYMEPCVFCKEESVSYDDYFGELCEVHYKEKVTDRKTNPWTGKPK